MKFKAIDCQQKAIDNNWDVTGSDLDLMNACHISNTNGEVGDLRDNQYEFTKIQNEVSLKVDFIFWIIIIIVGCVISLVVKKMWGK